MHFSQIAPYCCCSCWLEVAAPFAPAVVAVAGAAEGTAVDAAVDAVATAAGVMVAEEDDAEEVVVLERKAVDIESEERVEKEYDAAPLSLLLLLLLSGTTF